jgi:enoyl-CoA hydratase/carnithine racemase
MATIAAATDVQSPTKEPLLLCHDDGSVRTLTLNRPAKYNALSGTLIGDLLAAFEAAAHDRSVHVIVLGAVGKAFSAGHDLSEVAQAGKLENASDCEAVFKETAGLMTAIIRQPQPVIARVQGIATAAGCQLVASCDLAVASTDARFATSGINAGLFCMTPSVALSRNVATKHAFEMLTTGEFISAKRASEIGLINRAVRPESLDSEKAALAETIAGKSSAAIKAGKSFFYKQLGLPLDGAYALSARKMAHNMTFKDAQEGIDAFLNKRKPVWRHE